MIRCGKMASLSNALEDGTADTAGWSLDLSRTGSLSMRMPHNAGTCEIPALRGPEPIGQQVGRMPFSSM